MSRGVWSKVFQNFFASLRPRQIRGNYIGEDYFLNKYYEIPADPRGGKRKPIRWFEPTQKEKFDQEIPAEWEAWLRGRRAQAPEPDEVLKSLAISQMKKDNAKKVAMNNPFVIEEKQTETKPQFPVYEDYELPYKKES